MAEKKNKKKVETKKQPNKKNIEVKEMKVVEQEVVQEDDFEFLDDIDEDEEKTPRKSINLGDIKIKKNLNIFNSSSSLILSIILLLLVIDTILLLVLISRGNTIQSYSSTGSKTTESNNDTNNEQAEYDVSKFTKIDANRFKEEIQSAGFKIIYTGSPHCGHCIKFVPIINRTLKEYNYKVLYLDTSSLTEEYINDIRKMDDKFADTFGATPMVYAIKDKKVLDVNLGATSYEDYVGFLEKLGIKKK